MRSGGFGIATPPGVSIPGTPGKSAYEIAVDDGFVGTETQWLDSIGIPTSLAGIEGVSFAASGGMNFPLDTTWTPTVVDRKVEHAKGFLVKPSYVQNSDPVANPDGLTRGCGFLFLWDVEENYVGSGIGVGPIAQANGLAFGPRGAFQVEGNWITNYNMTWTIIPPVGFANQTMFRNQSDPTHPQKGGKVLSGGFGFIDAPFYFADGGFTNVMERNDTTDGPTGFIANAIITGLWDGVTKDAAWIGFATAAAVVNGAHMARVIGFEALDVNVSGGGIVDHLVGFHAQVLTGGAKNTAFLADLADTGTIESYYDGVNSYAGWAVRLNKPDAYPSAMVGYKRNLVGGGLFAGPTNATFDTQLVRNAAGVWHTFGSRIVGLPTGVPPLSTEAVPRSYLDLGYRPPVAAVAAGLAAHAYANGTAGVGATLTRTGNGALTAAEMDGVTPAVGQRLLVTVTGGPEQGGIYTITSVGSAGAPWVLTRSIACDEAAEMKAGASVFVIGGSNYGGTEWYLAADVVTVGTSAATWQAKRVGAGAVRGSQAFGSGQIELAANASAVADVFLTRTGVGALKINATSLGFFNGSAATKPVITGSRGGNAALASLLTGLASLSLITDSTTA